jgi:nicotinate-nucleotide adenylyltransferase
MARAALTELELEKILWIPTGAPGYRQAPVASGKHRVAMLALALEGEPRHEIDQRELGGGATGYTYDTLTELRLGSGPSAELWLLMGADQYAKFEQWHRPNDIRKLARIGVFARPGWQVPDAKIKAIPFQPMSVSASEIRARAARGEDVSHLVPPGVANYIAENRLYR